MCSGRHKQTTFSDAYSVFIKLPRVNICLGARKNPLIEAVLLSTNYASLGREPIFQSGGLSDNMSPFYFFTGGVTFFLTKTSLIQC